MSANVDPNLVGGFLLFAVVGIFILYAWVDHKKNSHYSASYSPIYERPETYSEESEEGEELDPEEIGYRQEMGRQRALSESRSKAKDRAYWEKYYKGLLITGVDPPKFDDPLIPSNSQPKKRKKNPFWDLFQ